VVEVSNGQILKSLSVGDEPEGVSISPDGKVVYITSEDDSAVSVIDTTTGRFGKVFAIDTATDKVVGSVDVGGRPWGIAITPDGKTLYTANGPANDVSVVDVASLKVTNKIKVGDRPWGVAILAR
jgi:YVTN family beta-propeller protein